jgi:peptide-methionine (S)-S-oxide reductase
MMHTATFGAGCFWGIEEIFRNTPGVQETAVGYMGGDSESPTYERVCTGRTNHAEVVQIIYNHNEVSYEELLNIFWNNHNPTTLNRQGPDVGTQYRSVIFFHTPEQEKAALQSKKELEVSGRFSNPIVTQVLAAPIFYKAEDYHQQYLQKRGLAYCHI